MICVFVAGLKLLCRLGLKNVEWLKSRVKGLGNLGWLRRLIWLGRLRWWEWGQAAWEAELLHMPGQVGKLVGQDEVVEPAEKAVVVPVEGAILEVAPVGVDTEPVEVEVLVEVVTTVGVVSATVEVVATPVGVMAAPVEVVDTPVGVVAVPIEVGYTCRGGGSACRGGGCTCRGGGSTCIAGGIACRSGGTCRGGGACRGGAWSEHTTEILVSIQTFVVRKGLYSDVCRGHSLC